MSGRAKIESVETLRDVKAMIAQFVESATLALVGVDADIARVKQWLNSERPAYWKRRIRELEDTIESVKAEIRRKEIVAGKDPVSVVDERRKLARAKARLDEAQRRADATRRWGPAWERESMLYKSVCAPLSHTLQADLPRAVSRLDQLSRSLEEYLQLTAPGSESTVAKGDPRPETAARDKPAESSARPGLSRDYRELRAHVPAASVRAVREDRKLVRLEWAAGEPDAKDRESLPRLGISSGPPGAHDTITVAWRATSEPSVFFARVLPASNHDSGWYLGPTEGPEVAGGFRVCPIRELLEQLPGLTEILSLGLGTLVVLTRGTIKTVLDASDREHWTIPTE